MPFKDFENDSDSAMKEFMCNIISEFGTATRIITLIKLCFKRNILSAKKDIVLIILQSIASSRKNPLFGCSIYFRFRVKRGREKSITLD